MARHWGLAQTVMADVVTIFSMGKRSVLRALLGVKRILDRSDPRFYHCKLFVDDYCVWLQAYRYVTRPPCFVCRCVLGCCYVVSRKMPTYGQTLQVVTFHNGLRTWCVS